MPIYFEDGSQNKIVHFGIGDVSISVAASHGAPHSNELVFVEHEKPHVIGAYDQEHAAQSTGELNCIRLHFDKVESLDVVVERMQKLRAIMVAQSDEVDYQDPPAPTPPPVLYPRKFRDRHG